MRLDYIAGLSPARTLHTIIAVLVIDELGDSIVSHGPPAGPGRSLMQPMDWNSEDTYWRENYRSRPYAGTNDYTYYQPGYRYGYESAHKYKGREWDAVENDLRSGWDRWEHRGNSTWENIKMAVRDAWDRVTGHHPVGTR